MDFRCRKMWHGVDRLGTCSENSQALFCLFRWIWSVPSFFARCIVCFDDTSICCCAWMDWWTQWIDFQLRILLSSWCLPCFFDRWLPCFHYTSICCPKRPVLEIIFNWGFGQFCSSFLSIWNSSCEDFSLAKIFSVLVYLGLGYDFLQHFCAFRISVWHQFGHGFVWLLVQVMKDTLPMSLHSH